MANSLLTVQLLEIPDQYNILEELVNSNILVACHEPIPGLKEEIIPKPTKIGKDYGFDKKLSQIPY